MQPSLAHVRRSVDRSGEPQIPRGSGILYRPPKPSEKDIFCCPLPMTECGPIN